MRLLPAGLLMFGLSLSSVRADGGVIRLREARGPLLVTIFTAAEPVQGGLCEVSVLVQRRDSGDAILDAAVELLLTPPPPSVAKPMDPLCGLPGAALWGRKPGQGATQTSIRATRAQASNKLLYAAPVRFAVPGNWTLDAIVTRGKDSANASCVIAVSPPAGRLRGLLPYLLLPPLVVILFAINRSLRIEPRIGRYHRAGLFCCLALAGASTAHAQIDPEARQLLHIGFTQSLHNDGPGAHYLFFYWNMPDFPSTNRTLRLVIAPTYLDTELGFRGLLGEDTDLGLAVFGGGFEYDYDEVRQGNYYRDESFDGHGGGARLSLYHLFNPDATIPLNGMLRAAVDYRTFSDSQDTAGNFVLPKNQPFIRLRAGFRYGGTEPVLFPRLAVELSGWYELEHRIDPGPYGFNGDRALESTSHRFFGRAQFNYTTPRAEHLIVIGLSGGATINADRFSCYRIGGALPFTSEFPLYLPGYFFGELSAKNYGLAYGLYTIPLGSEKQWSLVGKAATALVDYVQGLGQPGHWNSGVGAGLGYTSKNKRWRAMVTGDYGIDAIRSNGRGGYNVAVMFQYNFGKKSFASDRAFEELRGARVPFR